MTALANIAWGFGSMARSTAFESCYRDHRSHVYRWGLQFGLGSARWAEDLTHDVFVRLLENPGALESEQEIGAWLYRVTANLAISRMRRERLAFGKLAAFFGDGSEPTAPAPDAAVEAKQWAQRAAAAVKKLPPRERALMCMKLFEGRTLEEIGQTLGMSKGYVSKLLARATERLRRLDWEVGHA